MRIGPITTINTLFLYISENESVGDILGWNKSYEERNYRVAETMVEYVLAYTEAAFEYLGGEFDNDIHVIKRRIS